jgi:hypothetical protein
MLTEVRFLDEVSDEKEISADTLFPAPLKLGGDFQQPHKSQNHHKCCERKKFSGGGVYRAYIVDPS